VEGPCDHGNESSGSIKFWEIFEWLSDCWVLKKDSSTSSFIYIYIERERERERGGGEGKEREKVAVPHVTYKIRYGISCPSPCSCISSGPLAN
jgi:hypothetical protein